MSISAHRWPANQPLPSNWGPKAEEFRQWQQSEWPIPSFVLLPPSMLAQIASHNSLVTQLITILDQVEWDDTASLEQASEKCQQCIRTQQVPAQVAGDISDAYHHQLGGGLIAIRSSLLNKQERFKHTALLNIKGNVNVIESVLELWARHFETSFLATRFQELEAGSSVPGAIILQKMIAPLTSGIGWWPDPLSERSDRLRVYSTWGQFRQNKSAFDSIQLNTTTGKIIDSKIGLKQLSFVGERDGFASKTVPTRHQSQLSLSADALEQLHQLWLQIRAKYNQPHKWWWSWDGKKIWLVDVQPLSNRNFSSNSQPVAASRPNLKTIIEVLSDQSGLGVLANYQEDILSQPNTIQTRILNLARDRHKDILLPAVNHPEDLVLLLHQLKVHWPGPKPNIWIEVTFPHQLDTLFDTWLSKVDGLHLNVAGLNYQLTGHASDLLGDQLLTAISRLSSQHPHLKWQAELPHASSNWLELAHRHNWQRIIVPSKHHSPTQEYLLHLQTAQLG